MEKTTTVQRKEAIVNLSDVTSTMLYSVQRVKFSDWLRDSESYPYNPG